MRHKRGDLNLNKELFWSYRNGKEIWLTKENFIQRNIKKLE